MSTLPPRSSCYYPKWLSSALKSPKTCGAIGTDLDALHKLSIIYYSPTKLTSTQFGRIREYVYFLAVERRISYTLEILLPRLFWISLKASVYNGRDLIIDELKHRGVVNLSTYSTQQSVLMFGGSSLKTWMDVCVEYLRGNTSIKPLKDAIHNIPTHILVGLGLIPFK